MGLARELTMGPPRRRSRARTAVSTDLAALRRMTAAERPDPATFRAVLLRVGSSPDRLRQGEGAAYAAAARRYLDLTGEALGPATITY